MEKQASYYIQHLELIPHPEGGFFKEIYRSDEIIDVSSLPDRYGSDRNFGTVIYYLLEKDQKSNFHILESDEVWHHIDGSSFLIHTISQSGEYKPLKVGKDLTNGELPQIIIPKQTWFAAELNDKSSFGLTGCTVIPGFDFDDFRLATEKEMLQNYPNFAEIIKKFS